MTGPALEPRRPWKGRRVVLGVAGGIAAYKSVQLARDLTRLGAEVDVILTRAAREFVGPVSFEGVTGRPVRWDLFERGGAALHVRLGTEAEAVVVAPATADLLARLAHGLADDLLTTTLLVTRAPVLLCPAMNPRMFEHPQTRANLRHVMEFQGHEIVGPASGAMAAGEEEGPGRMVEPVEILEHVGRALGRDARWEGRYVLVTAGPTREPVDPVRFVGNRSSGRMGFALAGAAWRRGARVTVVAGPTPHPPPPGVECIGVETAREMEAAVRERAAAADVILFAAAVADYRPAEPREGKLKRSVEGEALSLALVANPDVAAGAASLRKPGAVLVGFALETEDLVENARRKLEIKGLDLVVGNLQRDGVSGVEVARNEVVLLERDGEPEELPLLSKEEVAEAILDRVQDRLPADR